MQSTPPKRTPLQYLGLVFRGICMGASDIVPGVSGGTMALILGIYEELLNSIKAIGEKEFIQAVTKFDVRRAAAAINLPFLIAVVSGIGIAILALSSALEHWLVAYPIRVWSFFFGLIVASVITVSRRVDKWNPMLFAILAVGTIGAYFLVGLVPVETTNAWWFLILTGAIVICAMILPGISGSFLLVLLGKYQYVLNSVNRAKELDTSAIVSLGLIAIGAAVGIVLFARLISWVFTNYHDIAIAFLTGLMIGSLRKVWPWKEDVEWLKDAAGDYLIRDGERVVVKQLNLLPTMDTSDQLLVGIALAAVGIVVVLLLERLGNSQGHE